MVGASLLDGAGGVRDTIKDTMLKTVISDAELPAKQ
jgi:hypothetical protein